MKMIMVLLAAGMIVQAHAQTDEEWRKQADRELLKEEPQSALFFLKQIQKRVADDKLREIEAELLRSVRYNASEQLNSFSKNDAIKKSSYYSYLAALVKYQERNLPDAILLVHRHRKKYIKAELLAGRIFLDQNNVDSAGRCFRNVLSVFQQDSINNYVQIARVRNFLGRTLRRAGRIDEAIQQYKIGVLILSNSPLEKWDDLGRLHNNLGIAYGDIGEYNLAKENYLQSSLLKDRYSTDSLNRATTYANLASFYSDYGNYLKSQEYHKRTIDLIDSTKVTNHDLLAAYCNNYGVVLMEMREYNAAAHHFQRSIDLLNKRKADTHELIPPIINLSVCLHKSGDKSGSRATISQLESVIRSLPDNDIQVADYWAAAGSLEVVDDPAKAEMFFINARNILETADHDPKKYAVVLESLGDIAMNNNDFRKASSLYQSAIDITLKDELPRMGFISRLYNDLGMTYVSRKMNDSAYYYLNKSLEINAQSHETITTLKSARGFFADPFELIVSQYQLADLHWKTYRASKNEKDLEKIIPSIEAAMEMIRIERDRMNAAKDKISVGMDAAEVHGLAVQVYFELFVSTGKEGHLSSLHNAMERARQQVMMSTLRIEKIEAFSGVTQKLAGYENDLNYRIAHLTAQLSNELGLGKNSSTDLIHEYDGELAIAQKRFRILTDSLKENLPDYYNLKYNNTVVEPGLLQRDVIANDLNKVLLQLHVADSSIIMLITYAKGRTAISVPSTGLSETLKLLRNQIHFKQADWRATSAKLYEVIMAPLDKKLAELKIKADELVIIPDGDLFFLPFEVLSRSERDPLLVERVKIQYALSSTLLWQKTTDKQIASNGQGFVGFVPTFEKDGKSAQYDALRDWNNSPVSFHQLASTSTEVNAVAKVLNKANVSIKVFEGQEASERNFKQSQPASYRYIHLATHGFVNMEEPDRSGLAFSPVGNNEDDILFSSEVYNLKLNADLVCLSACETGLGKVYRGEGLMGFTRGFFYAGARNMVVSLWRVDDRSTSEWMIALYSQLTRGKTNTTAVQTVKRQFLKHKVYNHPYYWAPFILMGG